MEFKYNSIFLKTLYQKIQYYTASSDNFNQLKQKPNLYYQLSYHIYNIEFNHIDLWRKINVEFDPRYFFDSTPIVKELEKERFKAFKEVLKL